MAAIQAVLSVASVADMPICNVRSLPWRWKSGLDRKLHQLTTRAVLARSRHHNDFFHDLIGILHSDPEPGVSIHGSEFGSHHTPRSCSCPARGIPEQRLARAASPVEQLSRNLYPA
jgi:hypothetical protein